MKTRELANEMPPVFKRDDQRKKTKCQTLPLRMG